MKDLGLLLMLTAIFFSVWGAATHRLAVVSIVIFWLGATLFWFGRK